MFCVLVHDEIGRRAHFGNTCYYLVEKLTYDITTTFQITKDFIYIYTGMKELTAVIICDDQKSIQINGNIFEITYLCSHPLFLSLSLSLFFKFLHTLNSECEQ
jgi:hypothetical protein